MAKAAKKAAVKKTVTTTTTTTTTTTYETPNLNAYILIDRSGSMVSLWKEAIGSVNAYVKTLQKEGTEGNLVVAFFDDNSFDVARKGEINAIEPITEGEFSPRGMTPLFDSFGKISQMAMVDKNDKTVIVVMTDGHENCSKEHNATTVRNLVAAHEKRGWEVIFLGANFDVSKDATAMGLNATKFAGMAKGKMSFGMSNLATRTRAYAGATDTAYVAGASVNYTAEDKEDLS